MISVKKVKALDKKKLHIVFSNGSKKIVDIKPFIKEGTISAKLEDDNYFRMVEIESGGGITWPNGFDFCPVFLYEEVPEVK